MRRASTLAPDFPPLAPNTLAARASDSHAAGIVARPPASSLLRTIHTLRWLVCALFASALGAVPSVPRPAGVPFLTSWDPDDYAAAPSNYRIVQHPQTGFIYAANNYGLLEFDGATWRLLKLRTESVVPIVVIDARGTIWAGGSNEVAVLRPDAHGDLQPVDVMERLPAAERNFGRLYIGTASPDGVYLASPTTLVFFGHDGSARTWPSGPTSFNGLCWLDGSLYVSRGQAGLHRLSDGALTAVAGPPRSLNPAVRDTLRLFAAQRSPQATEAILLTDIGPMRWAGPGQPMTPVSAAASALFAQESAITAAFLPNGGCAFFFQRQGLCMIAADGTLTRMPTAGRRQPDGPVQHIVPDDQGGLWLARTDGITRLQLDARFATQASLDGARSFQRRGDRLYIAHYTGVSWRDDATGTLHPVTGFPTGPSMLVSVGERIFATGQFLREITRDDRAVVALPLQFNSLAALPGHPGVFVGGSIRGLRLVKFDGATWQDQGLVAGVRASVGLVRADRDGFVWAAGYIGTGSWRVDFRAGPRLDAAVQYLDPARGLPFLRGTDFSLFQELGGDTIAIREGRLLRYDRTADRFVPEDRIDHLPAFDRVHFAANDEREPWGFVQSPVPLVFRLARTGQNRWRAETYPAGPLQAFVSGGSPFFDSASRTLWFCSREPPITFYPDWRPGQPPPPLRAVIRRLATAAGELLHAASGGEPADTSTAPSLRFAPTQNSIRLAFAAPAFAPDHRGNIRTVYRTRLEGVERTWTNWSSTPWREFTDLPYRDFVFHVQARDIDGRESAPASLAFAIAPPWWLARPALAGYALATLAAVLGLFRLRTRALRRRNDHLETVVAARTSELERLRRLEMDEKISARLAEEKARLEVLRYQLNPHFLFNSLNSIYTLVWSHSRPAGDLVRKLAEFCRMTLTRSGAETATLAEEFAMLRAYLDLEQIRWQENLRIEFSLAPELEPVRLPPFLLLPLVENAVKYGSHTSPDLLRLRVTARPDAHSSLVIEIANSGTWVEPGTMPQIASTNIGLENLRQRLARHYPEAHTFAIRAEDGWVVARLWIQAVESRKA